MKTLDPYGWLKTAEREWCPTCRTQFTWSRHHNEFSSIWAICISLQDDMNVCYAAMSLLTQHFATQLQQPPRFLRAVWIWHVVMSLSDCPWNWRELLRIPQSSVDKGGRGEAKWWVGGKSAYCFRYVVVSYKTSHALRPFSYVLCFLIRVVIILDSSTTALW
jgi:hypothetical protein